MKKMGILSSDINKIDENIRRVGSNVDHHLQSIKISPGEPPIFSKLEFSITELCNRKCIFCPRIDPEVYPNRKKHLTVELYEKVMRELAEIKYTGGISYSGFGEPFLHPKMEELIRITRKYIPGCLLEVYSNGDFDEVERLKAIFNAELDTLIISMYDGKEQIEHFNKVRKKTNLSTKQILLRIRYKPPEDHYGLTISNRTGTIDLSHLGIGMLTEPLKHPCFYPHYRLMVDYNGEVLLCSHDWAKKSIVGNLNDQGIYEIWMNKRMHYARQCLGLGDRSPAPCNQCNVKGTRMGGGHFSLWTAFYQYHKNSST